MSSSPESAGRTQLPQNVPMATMDQILKDCPHFRILVVGKTGAGKSSLINAVFQVQTARVSHDHRGQSNIEDEIRSPSNERVVVHDSMGIEPGGTRHLDALTRFIETRSRAPRRADRLDCVWICIQIPVHGERVLEKGTETLVKFLIEFHVPYIIVFTKYDRLVDKKLDGLYDDAGSDCPEDEENEEFMITARRLADETYENQCIKVIEKWALAAIDPRPRMVKVSTLGDYQDTLTQLVQLTTTSLPEEGHDPEDPDDLGDTTQIRFTSAQRIDPLAKVKLCIRVGERRYWRGLASSAHFPNLKLDACLEVLHSDIVDCWNIPDPDHYLKGLSFQDPIIAIVGEDSIRSLSKHRAKSLLAAAAGVSGVLGACTGPVAPIVAPTVFVGLVIGTWIYNTYKSTPETLRHLMRYIINLTNIMYDIFLRSIGEIAGGKVSEIAVAAVEAYKESKMMADVHTQVEVFIKKTKVWNAMDKDYVLEEIKRLLYHCAESRH